MAIAGKEDDAEKAQTEISRETKVSENVKEDAKVVEGNGELKKIDEGKNNVLPDGNEKENAKENENGACNSSPPSDGNKKEDVEESEKDDRSLPLSDENEKEKAINECDEKDEGLLPLSDENDKKNVNKCEKDEFSLPAVFDENEKEIVKDSENDEFSYSAIDTKDGELSLPSEENGLICNLTEFEKKGLMELRSKIEEGILSNTLSAKNEDKREQSQKELNSVEKEEKSKENVDENEKQEKSIEENVENHDEDKKSEINVEIDKDISLWGVPLLPSKEDKRTDTLLFKFLKARDFKPNDALEMLKNTLEWRKENKIESIIDENLGNDQDYDSVAFMKGFDREGHPICYNVYGVFANEEMYNKTFENEVSREKFLRWRIQLLEKEILKLDFRPGGISTLLQVNDLKNTPGPSRRDLRLATKRALGIFQDNYPEFVARNIFINVPFWYYAFNAVLSPFLMQRTKSKFVFSRPSRVTETLLKYIAAEEIPVVYGGLRRENDPDFSTQDVALEINVKAGATETVEIPTPEVGNSLIWDLAIIGWDVNYKEEFVPTDEGSYTVIVKKGRKISWQQEPIRNCFKNKEPGKVVITIENSMFKKKRVLYRYKTKNHSEF